MKLFFIVENDEPYASGGGYYALFKFAEHLALMGNKVFVYGVLDLGWVKPGDGLSIVFRPRMPRTGRFRSKVDRVLSKFGAKWLLPFLIRRFRPDWILGVLTHSAIKAESLGRRMGIPVANFIYECPPWMNETLGAVAFEKGYDAFARRLWEETRRAYLGSKVLFPNSRLSQRYNQMWLEGKPVADPIHPGIDPGQMPFGPVHNEPLRLDPDCKHVLSVGRLVEGKNIHQLIAAFRRLRAKAQLHICGAGPEMERLRREASGSPAIHFHGYLSDADLWSLFRQCALVAYPSGFEGFGMPPMQALYFGKPCIASDLEIFRSIFANRLEYFPLGDVDALAAEMDRLLADPEYCRQRGEAGRRFIIENFTWSVSAARIDKTLREQGCNRNH